ncbi:histidinol dehydrogenase [Aminicella lysinilytica]|uniref:Histidinol dehydrogenase n=1 Tax=Aminicella lysinilytica TaxID=433323 RepID=A0A4R6Q8X1_9FIRM|nr:histidinol dehydrogenase [Aminicella lysinilytica]TDP59018.1 histidinol dehydrogenase [Aminicella lysinilytica]
MKIIKKAKERTAADNRELRNTVQAIIDNVCADGDRALKEYSNKFDDYVRGELRVSRHEIDAAYEKMSPQDIEDLKAAKANIEAFAKAQRGTMTELENFSPQPGIYLGHKVIPVSSCCCYVPGGSYPLYSTALMLITPAKVAGVKRVAACAPVVHGTGDIHYKTLVAMDLAGADEIYAVGGAQAIAAFAYGTQTIKPVDMIVGPGNKFVAEAKRQCYGQIGIDFIAGPSEVLVIADTCADPKVLAADLLAQCEHDPNAKAFLLSTDETLAIETIAAVEKELETLDTAGIARRSWDDYGEVVVLDSLDEAVETANNYAPEHLEVNIAKPEQIINKLVNYGSLFIGGNTAEVFGDYASGTNHTLPTVKASRYTGGVWVGTFLKVCTNQWMTPEASRRIAPLVNRMAKGEGLSGHALAAERRF